MNIWHDINKERIKKDEFTCVIEISKGSKKKYELDKETGLIVLDRILHTSMQYPANYGFIPRTYGDDKDPLDVLVICSEVIEPLTLVDVYPIGVIYMEDGGEGDEKILAIPFGDAVYNSYKDINEIPKHIVDEMCHFFSRYKDLEKKSVDIKGIGNKDEAIKIIEQSIKNYNEKFNN